MIQFPHAATQGRPLPTEIDVRGTSRTRLSIF